MEKKIKLISALGLLIVKHQNDELQLGFVFIFSPFFFLFFIFENLYEIREKKLIEMCKT